MGKKVFIVSSTPRKNGNSEILAEEFARGAREAGHTVELLSLRGREPKFCIGCLYCQKRGVCVLQDGMNELYPRIREADALVFATPIYYYEMCGQLKTFLDRLNPLFPQKNRFRKVYLLASAADTEETAMDGAVKGVQGWVDCFEDVTLAGAVRAVGVEEAGAVRKTDALRKAYELGKSID